MRRLLAALALCVSLLCRVALPLPPRPAMQAQQDSKTQTVYITRTGKKYSPRRIPVLAASKIPISLNDAKPKGYTAYKVCHPPE